MRKNSFASLALLLGGIFVLGIGLSHTLWLKKSASKSLAGANAVNALSPESAPVIVPQETTSTRSSLAKVPPATLDIEVEHNFTQARLSVWVDDHSIYTHLLEGTDKKRLAVFHGVHGHESHAMQLAPGKHRVRVPRTQEFVLRWSPDGGRSFREIVRQQWNFSPPNSIREREEYQVHLSGVTVLELVIVPDISGGLARASLKSLRLS
jgi:hypothetical protein